MFLFIQILAALVASIVAIVAVHRPMVACPAAGLAGGILLVVTGELAVMGLPVHATVAGLVGTTATGWGGWHAFVQTNRSDEPDGREDDEPATWASFTGGAR